MARCPFALWRPLPENATQADIDPDQAILHTAVDGPGRTSLFGYFGQEKITLESTFYVFMDGSIEQYMDTTVRADANRDANVRAISIETEDDGRPDITPWTPAQVKSLIKLLDWICEVHPKVQRRLCPAWDQAGIGYHTMWGAPSHWTPTAGKTCPGKARIPQVPGIVDAVIKLGVAAPPAPKPIAPIAPVASKEYEDMHTPAMLVKVSGKDEVYVTDCLTKQHVKSKDHVNLLLFLGTAVQDDSGKPFVWSAAAVDSIRTVA